MFAMIFATLLFPKKKPHARDLYPLVIVIQHSCGKFPCLFNGNFRILKWSYCTICLAIFCGDIPLHRPKKYAFFLWNRYLHPQSVPLRHGHGRIWYHPIAIPIVSPLNVSAKYLKKSLVLSNPVNIQLNVIKSYSITINRKKSRTAGAKVLRLASHQGLGGHWLQGGMSKKRYIYIYIYILYVYICIWNIYV